MKVSPSRVARSLCLTVFILILLHLSTQALSIYGGHGNQLGFQRQFNLNEENNIPTWFSSSTFLACSVLLSVIGWAKRGANSTDARSWLLLAAVFLYLSMDEASSLHEMLIPLGEALLQRIGLFNPYLFYSWVPFGMIALAIIGLINIPFLKNLPKDTRRRFLFAGCIYISGAVVTEMAGGAIAYYVGTNSLPYAVEVVVEEGLEMLGIIVFLYGILMHIRREDVSTVVVQQLLRLFTGEEKRLAPFTMESSTRLKAVRRG
jgi:hypothetical protein